MENGKEIGENKTKEEQFVTHTGCDPLLATFYLDEAKHNVKDAVEKYFTHLEHPHNSPKKQKYSFL
jgi:hypothetical protein